MEKTILSQQTRGSTPYESGKGRLRTYIQTFLKEFILGYTEEF